VGKIKYKWRKEASNTKGIQRCPRQSLMGFVNFWKGVIENLFCN
jgi:hypothetical protein